MRHIRSEALSSTAVRYLNTWTGEVEAAPAGDRKEVADARWEKSRKTKTIAEVRRVLRDMNGPLGTHCMYCEYNEAAHIDHFEPRASDPLKTFEWENLHQACDLCDSNHKRDRFLRPEDGVRPLSPRQDDPDEHFRILPSGKIRAPGERGRWTVELFGLERLRGQRMDRWVTLQALIEAYASAVGAGQMQKALNLERSVRRGRFLSVLRNLLAAASGPKAKLLGLEGVRKAIDAHPEISTWVS